jgi:hypothetical protein
MNRKKLIVSGCSFTKGHHLTEDETWGGHLAKKMDYDFLNLAMGGQGNDWISQKIITHFLNNPEDKENSVVAIGWSDASRLLGTFHGPSGYLHYVTIQPQDFHPDYSKNWPDDETSYHGYVKKNYKYLSKFFDSYAYCLYRTYYSIYLLKQYLESNNIPYLFFDAINQSKIEGMELISKIDDSQYIYNLIFKSHASNSIQTMVETIPDWMIAGILNEKAADEIFNTDKYISFDGHSMLSYMHTHGHTKFTEGNPGHPNELAADIFSTMILKEYERLYNN